MGRFLPREVEGKYRVSNPHDLERKLSALQARFVRQESHRDTYLKHPCRDFRQTDEALRIRIVDGQPWMTYKGPRLDGLLKIRPEIELPLVPDTLDSWLAIWAALGFETVATVVKVRRVLELQGDHGPLIVCMDAVDSVGLFSEIERVVESEDQIPQARQDIESTAKRLGLEILEPRSYLAMVLAANPQ